MIAFNYNATILEKTKKEKKRKKSHDSSSLQLSFAQEQK